MPILAALLWLLTPALAAEPARCREVDAHFVLPQTSDGAVAGATASAMSKAFGGRPTGNNRFRITISRCPAGTKPSLAPERCTPVVPPLSARRPTNEVWDRTIFLTDGQVASGLGSCKIDVDLDAADGRSLITCQDGSDETFAQALRWMLDPDDNFDGYDACAAPVAVVEAAPVEATAPTAPPSGASGYGQGGGDFGPKGQGGSAGVGGSPTILGSLDSSLIQEVVKRHISQIRYCYQRELTKNPTLGGDLTVKFTIAADGTVPASLVDSTTLNNPAVESCIEGRFKRMQFPQPKGGGIVIVTYPFVFQAP